MPICPEALGGWICTKFGIGGPLVDVINCAYISLFADDAKLSKHTKAPTNRLELQEATTALYMHGLKNGCWN